MSIALEAFLARLYVDAEWRGRFLADPRGQCTGAGLSPDEIEALVDIDRVGLALAADSYARKHHRPRRR